MSSLYLYCDRREERDSTVVAKGRDKVVDSRGTHCDPFHAHGVRIRSQSFGERSPEVARGLPRNATLHLI
jgi:hypothetical protein